MTDTHKYPAFLHRPRKNPVSISTKQAVGTRTSVDDVTLKRPPWEKPKEDGDE